MTVCLHRGILQSGQHTFMVSDNIQPTPLHRAIFGWLSSSWLSLFKYGVWRPNTWSDGSSYFPYLSSVQSLSLVWLFATPQTATRQASLFITKPRVYPNSCPLSQWCHPTISPSVIPFSCLQSFPESGSFQMSQFFTSGGQSIGVSTSASVLPMNIQDWPPLGCTGWISLQSKGLPRVFSNTTVQKHQFFGTQLSL